MERAATNLRDLLVVEDDEDIAAAMKTVLMDEGYLVHVARTPEDALAVIDERTFGLVLADVFPTDTSDILVAVDAVRERAFPTPVLLVTARRLEEAEVIRRGFCGLVAKPFDIEHLLAVVAACLNRPLDAQQERQAAVVRRYFAALGAKDWDALMALCAADVTYVLPGATSFAQVVTGREAFRAFSAETFAQFPDAQFAEVAVYALPLGLAARYTGSWRLPDGNEMRQSGAVVFRFAGEQIAHIGIQLNAKRLEAMTGAAR